MIKKFMSYALLILLDSLVYAEEGLQYIRPGAANPAEPFEQPYLANLPSHWQITIGMLFTIVIIVLLVINQKTMDRDRKLKKETGVYGGRGPTKK